MSEATINSCNYVAAFVDILGQQERLNRFSKLPDLSVPGNYDEFIRTVKKTVGTVKAVREHIETFFEAAQSSSSSSGLPEPFNSLTRGLTRSKIGFQKFSDGLLVYTPLGDKTVPVPGVGISNILLACGSTCLVSLAAGSPIRVGIDLGWGLEYDDSELYGSVVSNAYKMESVVAQYPRVVVGPLLEEYLRSCISITDPDFSEQTKRKTAETCLSTIIIDNDGYPVVNYLGRLFQQLGNGSQLLRMAVENAYKFILDESGKHMCERNTKLALRYSILRQYFEHHISEWGIKPAGKE